MEYRKIECRSKEARYGYSCASGDIDYSANKLAFSDRNIIERVVPLAFAMVDFANRELTMKTVGILPFWGQITLGDDDVNR
jgi:hypothetical protein